MFTVRFFLEWSFNKRPTYSALIGKVFDAGLNKSDQDVMVAGCSLVFKPYSFCRCVELQAKDLETMRVPDEFTDGRLQATGVTLSVDVPRGLQSGTFEGSHEGAPGCAVSVNAERVFVCGPSFTAVRKLYFDVLAGDVTLHN